MNKIFNGLTKFFKGDAGLGRAVIIGIAIMVIVGLSVFLFDKGNNLYNGWEILMNQSAGEWFRMIFFALLGGVVVFVYIRLYKKTQDVKSGTTFAFFIALIAFLGIAFGKGCTDKANDGITSDKGRPTNTAVIDSSRVAAEDLLPKK